MGNLYRSCLIALAFLSNLNAQGTTIVLEPLVSGLDQPVLITNAHDGSNNLYVVEQRGRILEFRPDFSAPSVFLNITARVLYGGERGLLSLAFHPQFSANGRYFVNYTRRPDGATVIAEYRAGTTEEIALLVIPQPFANHNGGGTEFGQDGFLYIGTGDGGSGNDPGNRAQDTNELLGKILRIDVDHPESATVPYSSPATNPFFGGIPGRDEIFAYGMRNPWRFSFDRLSGLLYAGDVGQDFVEEIDIVRAGGNYGWRILEGTQCSPNDPGSCSAPGFTPPITEYNHTVGRCSITGGYVYRGAEKSLPYGSYVFGDFCTGEIFLLKDGVQSRLLDTSLQISSFGEDETGELYVVSLNGAISRIRAGDLTSLPALNFSISDLGYQSRATDRDPDPLRVGYARIQADGGAPLPSGLSIFGFRSRGVLVSETTVPASSLISSGRIYAEIDGAVNTGVAITNPNGIPVTVSFFFTDETGVNFGAGSLSLSAGQQIASFLNEAPFNGGNLVRGTFTFNGSAAVSVVALRGLTNERSEFLMTTLPVIPLGAVTPDALVLPQFADGGGWKTLVLLINSTEQRVSALVELLDPTGGVLQSQIVVIAAGSSARIETPGTGSVTRVGSVHITPTATASPGGLSAATIFSFREGGITVTAAGVPSASSGTAFRTYVEASGNFNVSSEGSIHTGVAIANTSPVAVSVDLSVGGVSTSILIGGNGQRALFLSEIPGLESLPSPFQGVLRITATLPIAVSTLRGRYNERREFLITTTSPVNESVPVTGTEVFFPYFVEGDGYSTQFILFGQETTGTMYFMDRSGVPAEVLLR